MIPKPPDLERKFMEGKEEFFDRTYFMGMGIQL